MGGSDTHFAKDQFCARSVAELHHPLHDPNHARMRGSGRASGNGSVRIANGKNRIRA